MLVAIFSEKQIARRVPAVAQDVTRLDIVNFISHGLPSSGDGREAAREEGRRRRARGAEDAGRSALEKYTVNLNAAGRAGRIDPLIGRQLEVERTIEILCRRRKNNPLYVGEAGVGKTAIVEGLARLIVEGQGARTCSRTARSTRSTWAR